MMLKRLQKDVESLLDECISLTYYMRGSIQYESMLQRTFAERQRISEFVEKQLEFASKMAHPIF